MKRIRAFLVVGALGGAPLTGAYAAHSFPRAATLPPIPIDNRAVDTDPSGESEFILRDKTEVQRGKVWRGDLACESQNFTVPSRPMMPIAMR